MRTRKKKEGKTLDTRIHRNLIEKNPNPNTPSCTYEAAEGAGLHDVHAQLMRGPAVPHHYYVAHAERGVVAQVLLQNHLDRAHLREGVAHRLY